MNDTDSMPALWEQADQPPAPAYDPPEEDPDSVYWLMLGDLLIADGMDPVEAGAYISAIIDERLASADRWPVRSSRASRTAA